MPVEKINFSAKRLIYVGVILAAISLLYFLFNKAGMLTFLENSATLESWIEKQGPIGPLLIVGLMIIAIIMSPIPSAPIALVSGALYGHTLGTIYIVIGSVLGASVAFFYSTYRGC